MRKHLLKQLTLVLLMNIAVPTLNAQVAHVGDILCEGNLVYTPANYPSSGATAIGVVFYVDDTGQHGWTVALQDAGSYSWGSYSNDTPLTNYSGKRQAIYDLDGYANTLAVREHSTNHPAFYAVDFENGWYVPAIGQLNYLYGNLMEVNRSLVVAGGTAFSATNWYYLSSTERGDCHAWLLSSSGLLDWASKSINRSVRGVRNF